MKKFAKVLAGLFLGVVIAGTVSSTAKADVVYVVNDNGVFAKDTNNPWYAVKMPAGSVIPAGSNVTFDMKSKKIETNQSLYMNPNGFWWDVASFDTTAGAQVMYKDGKIQINPYNKYGRAGDWYLGTWQAQKEAAQIAELANYYNWGWQWEQMNSWQGPGTMPEWWAPSPWVNDYLNSLYWGWY